MCGKFFSYTSRRNHSWRQMRFGCVWVVWVTWSKKMIKVRLRQYRDTRRDIYLLFDVTSESALQSSFFLRCNQISKSRLLAEVMLFIDVGGFFLNVSFPLPLMLIIDFWHWLLLLYCCHRPLTNGLFAWLNYERHENGKFIDGEEKIFLGSDRSFKQDEDGGRQTFLFFYQRLSIWFPISQICHIIRSHFYLSFNCL